MSGSSSIQRILAFAVTMKPPPSWSLVFSIGSSSLQDLPNFSREILYRKRLLDIVHVFIEDTVLNNRIIRISRHIKDFHAWMKAGHPLCQIPSVHLGHDHIGQHEMNGALVLLTQQKGNPSIGGFENPVPLPLQD